MVNKPIHVNNDKILNESLDPDFRFKKHLFVKNDPNYDPKHPVNI